MSLMDALCQLWTPHGFGIGYDLRGLSQEEQALRQQQAAQAFANCEPSSSYYAMLAQYKEAMWVPPGWQYWFEIGDELH